MEQGGLPCCPSKQSLWRQRVSATQPCRPTSARTSLQRNVNSVEGSWFVSRWIAWRNPLLAVGVLLAVASFFAQRDLQFDRSIENMFPASSPLLSSYRKLKRTFAGNEIVLAVYQDDELFNSNGSGIRRLTEIRRRVERVPGVMAVLSIDQPLAGGIVVGDNPLSRKTRELLRGYTHGADGRTVSLVCMLDPAGTQEMSRRETIDQLRAIMQSLPEPLTPGQLTGEPVLVVDGFRYVELDGQRLGRWSAVLLGLTIVICFRSLRWVIIPIAVVQLALMMTRGLLAVVQLELSMVSSMLTAVVMVIGVATMVHVIVRFRESRSMGLSTLDSLRRTCQILAVPIFWACVTDAVGFLSLTVSSVGPVQDFGLMMAIGSLMVLASVILILPGSVLWGRYDADPRAPWGESRLVARLQMLLSAVGRHPQRFLLGMLALTAIAVGGLTYLQVETDFTRNFRAGSEIVTAYNFVEEHLGGAGVCDLVIPSTKLGELDWEFLHQVHQLEARIHSDSAPPSAAAITNSFSLSDALIELTPQLERQPRLLRNGIVKMGLTTIKGWMPEFFHALHGQDPETQQHYLRVMLRVRERQSADEKKELIEYLKTVSSESFPDTEVTGYFVLLTHLIDSVIRDQWRTFLVAVVSIGLIMWVSLRNLRLALIALVPNAFPILIVLGGMGWVSVWVWDGLRINMGTAMIAAVSMGLSIDSSIHYMIGFQRARREGLSVADSLRQVQASVGKAMVLSTLALTVGFSVLASSQFVPTVYFGTLVSLSMLGGLAGNLVVLPALLQTFAPEGP